MGTDVTATPLAAESAGAALPVDTPGGSRELLKLALPLILANSFTTIQFTVDRVFLSWYHPDAMGASMPAAMVFWFVFAFVQGTAGYVSTFVAQYTGANRPHRVGPAVWHGIHLALAAGILFWLLWPLAPAVFELAGHEPHMQALESTYFRTLCAAAMPMGIVAAVTGFFSGRGDSWTVLLVNAVGTIFHIGLDYLVIFGRGGFPEMGIAGAGWAATVGAWASALLAVALFARKRYCAEFDSLNWRPERELSGRLLKFGGPAGLQWALDAISFTLFTLFVGRLGPAEQTATSLTFTLNLFGFLPMMGMGQAIAILVGQRLGENRPDLAERSTILGMRWAAAYAAIVGACYVVFPHALMTPFEPDPGTEQAVGWPAVAAIVPTLLLCVATYSLADTFNVTYSFALRGAGDTRFVSLLTFALAWPCMVIPTFLVVYFGGSVYLAWGFATFYIAVMAGCFWWRFNTGKWKAMRVIEPEVV
ncbi:MATE family efflux transporter [Limnoglobus roseus]|uniref:Multidrug-efflux transporter n=1 Tax=Limnoglobus roseus TaxID=2598579 RepID=A0A5C1A834_9BACT|nr:MATE family efflux transporter [Limnoglobus roseus]QEL14407.1 MATE family efflux transporter [Limnoglobus roseus]